MGRPLFRQFVEKAKLELLENNFFLYKNWGINIMFSFLCKKPPLMQKVTFYVKGAVFVQKLSFCTKTPDP
jgi:hypothetical protein